ncbi:hypothetical protein N9W01_00255 [bacterium]|nr:hypothetical protein [bacterium]
MPNWKKVITSGSDALLNEITSSGGIQSTDVTIADWGSVSASLASINSDSSNLTLQDVTDNGSTTTNDITVVGDITASAIESVSASIDYALINDKLQGNGSGFQFFAYNEDTIKTKFANWYSSNDRQYGMGQLWYETWFAAIDNQAGRDNRRIGFYLEEPNAGSTDSGTPGQHPSNARFYVDINGGYLSGSLNTTDDITVTGDVDADDITIDDWGSVSASLASLDASIYGDSDVTDHINSLNVHSGSHLGTADTDDLDEGSTNLYYTDGRVKTKLNAEGVLSGSSQVSFNGITDKPTLISGSNQLTGSLVDLTSNQTISGDKTFANIVVNGTASIQYLQSVTGSAKIIGDAYIILNAESPTERYAGIKVYDSGSGDTGSLEYDSLNNHWFYESTTEGYASGLIAGPRDSRGNITFPPNNRIPKGIGGNHISASSISDNGSTITLGNDTVVVGNLSATTISNVLSSSAQISNEISGAFTSTSASIAADIATLDGLTLQDVTDNGSTTTNTLTINNGTLGATSLHVDGNHDFPLKVTSDNLTGDPYMELGGGGIRVIDSPTSAFHIYMDQNGGGSVTEVARFSETQFTTQNNANIYADGELFASGGLSIYTINNAGTDTDKFLVLDAGGNVDFRTGAELRSDIGAGTGAGSVTSVGGTGTVSGLSLGGTVTTSGSLTLSGTISIDSTNITDVDAFSQSGTYANLRAQATTKGDVGLGNVENTALSTWAGSSNITTLGTVTSGDISALLPASDNYGEWHLAGESDSTDVTSGKFVKFTGGQTISGTGTELNPYIMTIVPTTLGTVTSGDVSAILPSGVISGSGQLGLDDTDDLSEGSTNLYYTDTRVKDKLDVEGVLSGSNTISGKALGSNLDSLSVDDTTIQLNSGTTYNGGSARTISAKTGTVANGNTTLVTGDAVYDYVNPISSSLASDINSKPSKYAASGSRMAVWRDNDTIRGYDSLHYFDNSGNDIGIRLNPSSVTGRTIRTGQGGGTTGVQILITRDPDNTYGATIDYVVFNSLTNRTAYRIGREISAWDNNGGNITGTGYTSFTYGTLPADLEVSIIESSGEMYLNMTWSGGGTYYISANIDTFGSGI